MKPARITLWYFLSIICSLTGQSALAKECGSEIETRIFHGDTAVDLAFILEHSTFAKKTSKGDTVEVSTGPISCGGGIRVESWRVMPSYNCLIAKSDPFVSKMLWDSLSQMHITGDMAMGEQTGRDVDSVRCTINNGEAKHIQDNPICEVTSSWFDDCDL